MTEAPEGSLRIFGHDAISAFVPFFLFVFTNALGVDYAIYLMSRIREEADETRLVDATRLSLLDLIQLGFAVALGVLIDTFVTRTLIVPSIVLLLGRWNWWPSSTASGSRAAA